VKHVVLLLLLCLFIPAAALAGEIREVELTDGSIITGEVLSLQNGIYTIRSQSLGTVAIEEAKVRVIRSKGAAPAAEKSSASAGTAAGEARSLQDRMTGDAEVMDTIRGLQNDPEFQKILEDPAVMEAVQAGDVASLMSNPRFMKLLQNPTVQAIKKKVGE
jgi:hypothetical protein